MMPANLGVADKAEPDNTNVVAGDRVTTLAVDQDIVDRDAAD
jgi:hypothetical protein